MSVRGITSGLLAVATTVEKNAFSGDLERGVSLEDAVENLRSSIERRTKSGMRVLTTRIPT